MKERKTDRYTQEQLKDAEQTARIIKSVPKERENILVTMTNVFVSGMETGERLSQHKIT